MRCERAQELFSDYCDTTLQPALLVPLESHLEDCADCRAQLAALKQVWQTLDRAPVVAPPAHFRALVWERIDAAERARQQAARPRFSFDWRILFTRPALAWGAALLLVIVLAGVVVPGRYTAARMLFPWNLIYRSEAPTWQVTPGPARVEEADGRVVLIVPLNSDISEPLTVAVKARSEGGQVESLTPEVTLLPGRAVEAVVWMREAAPNRAITLEVSRKDRPDKGRALTIRVPNDFATGH